MKNLFRVASLLVIFSGLLSCASPNMKHSVVSNDVVKVSKDKALVNFIRPNKLGFLVNAAVYDGDKFVCIAPYGQKFSYEAEPGKHLFMVASEAADFMAADLVAGKTYYVVVAARMGAWRARFSLDPVSKEELKSPAVQKWINTAQPIKNTDSAYAWANENNASVQEKKAAYFPKWKAKPEGERPHLKAEDGQ